MAARGQPVGAEDLAPPELVEDGIDGAPVRGAEHDIVDAHGRLAHIEEHRIALAIARQGFELPRQHLYAAPGTVLGDAAQDMLQIIGQLGMALEPLLGHDLLRDAVEGLIVAAFVALEELAEQFAVRHPLSSPVARASPRSSWSRRPGWPRAWKRRPSSRTAVPPAQLYHRTAASQCRMRRRDRPVSGGRNRR